MTWQVVPGNGRGNAAGGQHRGDTRSSSPGSQGKEPMTHGNAIRILIVDDEPSICKALTMALSRAGYDAISALTGETAVSIVRGEHIDVLLIDLRIPDMRGDVIFEVAASHQAHLKYQTLFMTGDITERAQKLISACKCNFLRKPFDLRDMTDAVAALLPNVKRHDAAG
jgi:two-component system, OmpR family, response regulator